MDLKIGGIIGESPRPQGSFQGAVQGRPHGQHRARDRRIRHRQGVARARAAYQQQCARTSPLSPSIAAPSPRNCSNRNSSAMRKGPLRMPSAPGQAGLRWVTAARCFSMKSGRWNSRCRSRSCACSRKKRSNAWAARASRRWTCAWWRPPTATWKKRSRQDGSARISTTRLNVIPLQLPPLRERGQDVLLLATHFLSRFSERKKRPPPWPGCQGTGHAVVLHMARQCPGA